MGAERGVCEVKGVGWWIMGHRLAILQRWLEHSIGSRSLFLALTSVKDGPLEA